MKNYEEIKGDLIELALKGDFDVIAHGCNCFCIMSAGIAPQMVKHFGCDNFDMELNETISLKKLGNIDFQHTVVGNESKNLYVVNAYTQFYPGQNSPGCNQPLDYEALTLCLRKMNLVFKDMHIGLPQIGCGLAGGDWNEVKKIIQKELINCNVTIVIYGRK